MMIDGGIEREIKPWKGDRIDNHVHIPAMPDIVPPLRGCGEREYYATNIIPKPQKPRRGDMLKDGDWAGEMETLKGWQNW